MVSPSTPAKASATAALPSAFLRVTMQNYDSTIADTDDLSTFRGGSLAALEAPRQLTDYLKSRCHDLGLQDVRPIATGASDGLYELIPIPPSDYEKAQSTVDAKTAEIAQLESAKKEEKGKKKKDKLDKDIKAAKKELGKLKAGLSASGGGVIDWTSIEEAVRQHCRDFLARIDASKEAHGPVIPWHRLIFGLAIWTPGPPPAKDLGEAFPRLQAALNRAQFRHPTVPIPDPGPSAAGAMTSGQVCGLTGLLPATVKNKTKGWISQSAEDRRTFGIKQKFKFYDCELNRVTDRCTEPSSTEPGPADAHTAVKNFLAETRATLNSTQNRLQERKEQDKKRQDGELDFALNFADLSLAAAADGTGGKNNSPLPPSVRGKMALIYLDGNAFGSRRDKFNTSVESYQKFSTYLEIRRARLLAAVLDWMLDKPAMIRPATPDDPRRRLRFETLLWGGDEILWVLPAAFGWELMGLIQAHLTDWRPAEALAGMLKPNNIPPSALEAPLTHAAGLLFCDDKAPIRITRKLVIDLGDAGKVNDADGKRAEENSVQALALEGADWAGISLTDLHQRWLGLSDDAKAVFSLQGGDWPEITRLIRLAKAKVGQSQLRRLYQEALDAKLLHGQESKAGRQKAAEFRDENVLKRIRTLNGSVVYQDMTRLLSEPLLCRAPERYPLLPLHQLLQVWDYVEPFGPPVATASDTEAAA